MSLLNASSVRARAKRGVPAYFSADSMLTERIKKQVSLSTYDIFLSHAFDDKEMILGVTLTLEDLGYTVYLDWRDDPSLDRKNVNRATALNLRERIRSSRCLFFATTENTSSSRWMPWELGFKDGQNKRSAILPVQESLPVNFKGQEYLGIYPYITQQKSTTGEEKLWVRWNAKSYVVFDDWLTGNEPYER
ncbi:MAG: TIR domain-containing protein [Desulfobulbaceae bacterium]|nr:TIR domain-containing protein [Desulfobulbaceae bacterium]